MGPLVVALFAIFFVIIVIAKSTSSSSLNLNGASASGPVSWYDALLVNGIPARGILLQVASVGTPVDGNAYSLRRFETRSVTIDVEIPGQAPYQINARPYIPSNLVRDVLPGATVELRIDPNNPNSLAIVGPGAGFAVAQLNAGPQQVIGGMS